MRRKKVQQRRNAWRRWLIAYLVFVILVGVTYNLGKSDVQAQTVISPLPETSAAISSAEVTPSPVKAGSESDRVREEIREVFGAHADKAFKLLACENSKLDPQIVNTDGNVPAGSKDVGVFQINEYWQETQAKFLLDPSINIRVAWVLYEENGYSFKLWTCGKNLGI